ncbi:MAG: hypothetical protein Q8M83_03290 [bacterium]|nr:hypothetical protein [bacterium]
MGREFSEWGKLETSQRYTGTEHEIDLLDTMRVNDQKFKNKFIELGGDAKTGYLSYNKALRLVRECQPGDPTDPKKDFSRDLRVAIIDDLKIEPGQENAVKIYTALRSPLDKFHGVDAVVEIEEGKKIRRATLDVSLNTKKGEGYKADVVALGEIPDPTEGGQAEELYLKRVEEIAEEIVKVLKKAA